MFFLETLYVAYNVINYFSHYSNVSHSRRELSRIREIAGKQLASAIDTTLAGAD